MTNNVESYEDTVLKFKIECICGKTIRGRSEKTLKSNLNKHVDSKEHLARMEAQK